MLIDARFLNNGFVKSHRRGLVRVLISIILTSSQIATVHRCQSSLKSRHRRLERANIWKIRKYSFVEVTPTGAYLFLSESSCQDRTDSFP